MKKTFLYVMMAAMALFTCTMSSCSDDDDSKNNEAEEAAVIDNINQCILNNFVVLDGDNNLAREGLYGGHKDAADTTSFLFQVADAEAAVKFYNALMPDSLVSKVKVDGQKRTLSYTQEGKQYTMIYAPATGENIATITLPNVEGYNKYARTVQLRDHVSDNGISAAQFKAKYTLGKGYRLEHANILVPDDVEEGKILHYYTLADEIHSPLFHCMFNNGKIALLVYFPEFNNEADRTDKLVPPMVDENEIDEYGIKFYPVNRLNTNQCYNNNEDEDGFNKFLPTMAEFKCIEDNLQDFVTAYNKENNADLLDGEQYNKRTSPAKIMKTLAPGIDKDQAYSYYATCETKNSLFDNKKVHCFRFSSTDDLWVNKNHKNYLSVAYICIKQNK